MKIIGIFDEPEQKIGFQLAGIESGIVNTRDEVLQLLEKINEEIGILVINTNIYNLAPKEFDNIQKRRLPLLLKIDK